MGILSSLFERRADAVSPIHPRDPALINLFGFGAGTAAGVPVSADTAIRINAVMACVKVISETIASLPLKLYKLRDDGGKDEDRGNPLWEILHDAPNRWQTSFEFREMMAAHVCLRGNAYARIVSTSTRGIAELVPLHPDCVRPFWAPDGRRAYQFTPASGPGVVLLQDEVFHVAGLSFDGLRGLDPISHARESLGLAIATEAFGARFFANDARPGVYLQHPGSLGAKAIENLRTSWEARHRGVANAHRPDILEEGMTVKEVGIAPENAQFLETRKFQIAEIARFFRVPPHMIADLDKATFSNIEQQSIEFVTHTLRPWLVRIEQAMGRDLLGATGRRTNTVEHVVDGLLRGDTASRNASYAVGRQWGWLSVNDILRMENRNPVPDGDIYLQPLNMATAGAPPPPALRRVADLAAERIVRKETLARDKALADGVDPAEWAASFWPAHARFVAQALGVSEERAAEYCRQRQQTPDAGIDAVLALLETPSGT